MALIDLLRKTASSLSLGGKKPLVYDASSSEIERDFAKDSKLDLDGKKPEAYTDNLPN
jgi:hypothetical protein